MGDGGQDVNDNRVERWRSFLIVRLPSEINGSRNNNKNFCFCRWSRGTDESTPRDRLTNRCARVRRRRRRLRSTNNVLDVLLRVDNNKKKTSNSREPLATQGNKPRRITFSPPPKKNSKQVAHTSFAHTHTHTQTTWNCFTNTNNQREKYKTKCSEMESDCRPSLVSLWYRRAQWQRR